MLRLSLSMSRAKLLMALNNMAFSFLMSPTDMDYLGNDTQLIARTVHQLITKTSGYGKQQCLINKIIQISQLTRSSFTMAVDDLVEIQGLQSLAAYRRQQIEFRCPIYKLTK